MQPATQSHSEDQLGRALLNAREDYVNKRPNTVAAFEQSTEYMPGGNTRTVLFHGPVPLRIASGTGCRVTDVDGFQYVNLVGEYTAGLFGHNHPTIRAAIDSALDRGVNLSAHNPNEVELARLVSERFPSIEKVRFTNSGTEANLLAISIARHVTGRNKVLVFDGGYHGGLLYFRGGGIPINAPFDYVIAPYNDSETSRALIRDNADQLACVLVEPMQGATGCIPARDGFLEMLRSECDAAASLLIFDEVMTSRLSTRGVQGLLGITPDMTTLGKYIGGGMSFGAFGGRADIMDLFDPRRGDAIPHAGTFNNNSLTMAAGVAAMREVLTDDALNALNQRGEALRTSLNAMARDRGVALQFTGWGSLLAMHSKQGDIYSSRDLNDCDDRVTELLFLDLLDAGFYMARRGFMALMLPLGDAEISAFTASFDRILEQRGPLLR